MRRSLLGPLCRGTNINIVVPLHRIGMTATSEMHGNAPHGLEIGLHLVTSWHHRAAMGQNRLNQLVNCKIAGLHGCSWLVHFSNILGTPGYPVWYTFWPIRMFRPGHSAAALSLHQHVLPKNPQGLASSRATLAAPQQALDAMDCRRLLFGLGLTCSVLFQKYIWYIGKKGWGKETLQEVPTVLAVTRFFHHRNQAALLVDHYLLAWPTAHAYGEWMLTEQSLVYRWVKSHPDESRSEVIRQLNAEHLNN